MTRLLTSLIPLLLATTLTGQEVGYRCVVVACDVPDGLRLTIDEKPTQVAYTTGQKTGISSSRAGTYSIKAEASGYQTFEGTATVQPGKIHTWILHATPIPEDEKAQVAQTRRLSLKELTSPAKITSPQTILLDHTGKEESPPVLLNNQPVELAPNTPLVLPPLPQGSELALATPGGATPFFKGRLRTGNHAIVAIYQRRDGALAATMVTH